jgi:beta-aspartyl-dipeptidase (metallo-type)
MLTLIRKAHLIDPEPLGFHDVLIAGSQIARVEPDIDLSGSGMNIIEAEGRWLLPGLVDVLTHPCGGGGEGGFGNRTAELEAADFLRAGITTPVGALGTDSITRTLEVLYGQVMKLPRTRSLGADVQRILPRTRVHADRRYRP